MQIEKLLRYSIIAKMLRDRSQVVKNTKCVFIATQSMQQNLFLTQSVVLTLHL